jgi:hypothetical protein
MSALICNHNDLKFVKRLIIFVGHYVIFKDFKLVYSMLQSSTYML